MTNSFNKKQNLITPERAAWFIPIFLSSGISVLLILFFVIPKYVRSNLVSLELNGLIQKTNELDNLKLQYKIINQKFEKLRKERTKIIELISGQSNLDTLIAKLGEIGNKNNIEFVSIAPTEIMNFVENKNENKNYNNNKKIDYLNSDSLLVEGTKKYLIDFTLNTEFANLISFLRELEFQKNLILIDDINLRLTDNIEKNDVEPSQRILEARFSIAFYGKI